MTAPNPVAFHIFGIDIRWYGILIATGFILAIIISYYRAPKHGIASEHVLDLAIWMIPISIIGARAYYVLFSWDLYRDNPISAFDIRAGGLAIHGGLIAGILTAYFVCRHYKIRMIEMMDTVFPTVALAQAIGRWGNFFNSEAHGGPTNLPWGIIVDGQKVHPTFLYESIWCFLLFLFLIWLDKRRKFPGQISCCYGMLYSFERGLVEQLRTDSLMIGPFKQAQVLSFFVFVFCLIAYIVLNDREKQKSKQIK
ncbi:MAG: prolipoprotein diacylglyceryl transferase [Eubacteriales bacterium]|nr:prolipoprotein diacylglyceryl transferase [Eubacteriales bacterium]